MARQSYKEKYFREKLGTYITDGVLDNKKLQQEDEALYNEFRTAYGNSISRAASALGLTLAAKTSAMLRQTTGDQVHRKEIVNRLKKHVDEIASIIRNDEDNQLVIERDELLTFLQRIIYVKKKDEGSASIEIASQEIAATVNRRRR